MASYLDFASHVPERWISAHDVVVQFCTRAADHATGPKKLVWDWETVRAREWEKARCDLATRILVQSTKDARLLAALAPSAAGRIAVVPPYFERLKAKVRTSSNSGPVLLFWGAMARVENEESAVWLAEKMLPALLMHLPACQLILAGSNPSARLRKLASDRIEVTGFVSDPQSVFDRADLAVIPLFRGAGIKVKALECLAAGLPTLTTAIGAEGISAGPEDGLRVIESSVAPFVAEVLSLWTTPQRVERLSEGAAAWATRMSLGGDDIVLGSSDTTVPNIL